MEDPNTTRPFNNLDTQSGSIKKELIKISRSNPKEADHDIFTSAIVKCDNITTEWLGGKNTHSFSYLSNPISMRDKYYYILKNKTDVFEMQIRYENNYLGSLDAITVDKFIKDINSKDLPKYHKLFIEEIYYHRYIILTFGILMMLAGLVTAILIMAHIAPNEIAFLSIFMFFGILLVLWGSYWKFTLDRKADLRFYQSKYKEYIVIIDKWNQEYFSRMGVHCTTTQDLGYIQFTNIHQRLVVQAHIFPDDIDRYPQMFEDLYIYPQSGVSIMSGSTMTHAQR
jgi:hypothetical protein